MQKMADHWKGFKLLAIAMGILSLISKSMDFDLAIPERTFKFLDILLDQL